MSKLKYLSSQFAVAPQITLDDIGLAATQGFKAIICNRPDGEDSGQLTVETIRTECAANGLAFTHIPVSGGISQSQISLMASAIDAADGPALAYCRSGTRSTNLWALAMATNGENVDELIAAAEGAGYDLSGLAASLRAAGAR